ncbi:MAG TPA: chemotaxis protein CheW [Longimicrobiaceae bacterium]
MSPDSPERARLVLEERARLLARPLEEAEAGGDLEVVTFELAGERYAIEAQYLLAVARIDRPTTVPGTDPTVFGVAAWRGELVLIRDYRPLLGLPVAEAGDERGVSVLVVGEDRPAFAILVEAVGEHLRIPLAGVHAGGDASGRRFVRGVTGGMVVVLDAIELWNLHG